MKIDLSEHFTYSKLLKFTIPSIIMMMFTSAYSVIDDGFFVSNFVGKDAFVALNLMSPILTIISAIGFMIGAGGNAIISKTLGEKKEDKADEYFSLVVYFTVFVSVVLTLIGLLALKPFCLAMGAKGAVLENCLTYGRLILPFGVVFLLQSVFQNLLITAGQPKLAMKITITSGISNITFDILLIVILKLGIVGTVWATISGALFSTIIPLGYFLFAKEKRLKFVKPKIEIKILSRTCYNGLSQLVSNLSMGLITILFNYQLMNIAGNNGVAAYGAIMYIAYVFVSAFMGYSMGAAPIVGYNYGAKNNTELSNIFKKSIIIITVMGIALFCIAEAAAVPFSGVFVSYDLDLWDMTIRGFRIYGAAFLLMGVNIFGGSFFTALDNGLVAGMLAFFRTFLLQVGAVFLLPIFLGLDGIWASVVTAELVMLLITIVVFRKMKKKYGY